ncbi:MAG: hypothetical protein JNJ73_17420 [Hyphomonadaceae bacterium]|nr:hypothetical protein [Hyphomonadaceae bacterium]
MVNSFKVGLVFALLLAFWHACWAVLVVTGVAQKLLDFVFWIHFIHPPYLVETFDPGRAGILVGVTAAVGMIGGSVGALLWNLLHRPR